MGSGINIILGIALTILAVIIISALLYGKDQGLLSKLAGQAMSLGDQFLPDTAPSELKQEEKLPSNLLQSQSTFVENIRRATQRSSGYCTLNFDLSGLGNYEMQINGPGIVTRIVNPKYSYTFGIFPKKEGDVLLNPVTLDNAEIYLLKPQKYDDCFRKAAIDSCKPEDICSPANLVVVSKDKVYFNNEAKGLAGFMLALPDKKRYCLVATHSSINPLAECDFTETTMRTKCLPEFKALLPSCI